MRSELNNKIRKSCIMGVVLIMIIFQVILVYTVLSRIEKKNISTLSNEVAVESKEFLGVLDNDLLTRSTSMEIEIGKITLIGILMMGTGLLLSIGERDTDKKSEESTYIKKRIKIDNKKVN